ncbi:putative transmembrane protein [Toxoplasma gondii TgCatPRC2]|uniref:Putative transmembrane protein n=1 Tax=Toxoplasma gondii TgCatPRC2 TaxID=1130821 RepID=A0A151HG33_TOXGO|nr:putative transmembrane protein [Toxoplasma gondii TgCatPRC2]
MRHQERFDLRTGVLLCIGLVGWSGFVVQHCACSDGVFSVQSPSAPQHDILWDARKTQDELRAFNGESSGELAKGAGIRATEGEVFAGGRAAAGVMSAEIPAEEGGEAAANPTSEREIEAPAAEDEAEAEISDASGGVAVTSPAAEEERLSARSASRPSGRRTGPDGVPSTRGLVFTAGGSILAAAVMMLLSRLSRQRSIRVWTVWREERQSLGLSVASDALVVASALVALLGGKRVVKGVMRKREATRRRRRDEIPGVEMPAKRKRRRSEAEGARATEGVTVSELVEDETPSHVSAPTEPGRTAIAATAVTGAGALAGSVALVLGSRRWFRYYHQVEEESRRLVAAGALFTGALFAAYKLFKQVRAKLAARRKKSTKA